MDLKYTVFFVRAVIKAWLYCEILLLLHPYFTYFTGVCLPSYQLSIGLFLNPTLFFLSSRASFRGCNMNLKHVGTLTPCSQCFSPPPTVHKQAPGCLIGQAGHRWRCSLSSPVVTGEAPPWFPQWSAPLVHLERGHSHTGATHEQTPTARHTCTKRVHTPRQTVCLNLHRHTHTKINTVWMNQC